MPAKVLVIEDEPDLVRIIARVLTVAGYAVVAAADGAAGLAQFHAQRPALVLLDVTLPDGDGFALCRALKAARGDIPVVFLSSRTRPSDRRAGEAAGAAAYLTKPFDVEALLAVVRDVLARRPVLLTP